MVQMSEENWLRNSPSKHDPNTTNVLLTSMDSALLRNLSEKISITDTQNALMLRSIANSIDAALDSLNQAEAPSEDQVRGFSDAELKAAIAEAREIDLRVNTVDEAFAIGYAYGRRDGTTAQPGSLREKIALVLRENLWRDGHPVAAEDVADRIIAALKTSVC